MPRLTNICVFLACGLMLYSATFLSSPSREVRRQAPPWSADTGLHEQTANDGELTNVKQQLDEAQRREEQARELLRVTQEQATGQPQSRPSGGAAPVASGAAETPVAMASQLQSTLDGTLDTALKLAAPRGPGFLMLTFSNAALKEHLFNFVAHAKGVGAAHLVGAVDVQTYDLLRELTAVYKTPLASSDFKMDGSNSHASGSWKRFAQMRTGEVARLVGLQYSVLHTDIDVIWLRDPAPYLMCSPEAEQGEFSAASRWPCAAMRLADVAVSSDNMSPGRDTQGHAAYSAGGTFNTGILFIRANAQGQAFAKAWHKNVADPERGSRFYGDTSDQQVFNHMMRDPSYWPGISATQGEHVMKTFFDNGGAFRLGALPMAHFINGHGYFVGSSHVKLDVRPAAVHATYSLDRHDGLAKRQRFRESGLWRSDPDEYFQGKYLALNASVSPAVQAAIAAFAARHPSVGPGNIGVHALALATHLAELRDGLALARALKRTLVLPRWLCYCDRLWSPSDDIFHFGCMYPGAQDGNFLPFVCPMDHVLSPTEWEQAGQPYRDASFLDSARLPAATRSSQAEIRLLPRAGYDALPQQGKQHALPLGVTDREAVALLSSLDEVQVLRIPHARGLLCGIEDEAERDRFNGDAAKLLRVPAWGAKCFQPCSSELLTWLTPEQIDSGGGARGNFWNLRVKPPPPFKAGTCVRNLED